jgi:hypothetical protein
MHRTVTFDTNTLSDLVWPSESQHGEHTEAAAREVRAAIEADRIQGFFCESLIVLEGIKKADRPSVFGGMRLETRFSSPAPNVINIPIAVRQDRPPLHPKFETRILEARQLGIRALKGPSRMGWITVADPDKSLFKQYRSVLELAECVERANDLAREIAARGLGYAVAVNLGLQLLKRHRETGGTVPSTGGLPDWWPNGLLYGKPKKIAAAIAECSDGEVVATHYGHRVDLLCTADFNKTGQGPSVLDPNNRAWLSEAYGIKFVTLPELANIVHARRCANVA